MSVMTSSSPWVMYEKQADGRFHLHLGPINQDGGERRLNVAITRARERMTVVSSFTAADMEHGRSNARGVALLRGFLAYAASASGRDIQQNSPDDLDAFERDVFAALEEAGLPVAAHYGASAVPITFALRHRDELDRFVLAVECDGRGYRDMARARDRERLRREQLEKRGWRYHRIWVLDWYANRAAELHRLIDAYHIAMQLETGPRHV